MNSSAITTASIAVEQRNSTYLITNDREGSGISVEKRMRLSAGRVSKANCTVSGTERSLSRRIKVEANSKAKAICWELFNCTAVRRGQTKDRSIALRM